MSSVWFDVSLIRRGDEHRIAVDAEPARRTAVVVDAVDRGNPMTRTASLRSPSPHPSRWHAEARDGLRPELQAKSSALTLHGADPYEKLATAKLTLGRLVWIPRRRMLVPQSIVSMSKIFEFVNVCSLQHLNH